MKRKNFLLTFVLALGACGVSLSSAQAQPDTTDAGKAENPPNWNMGGGAGGRRGGARQQLTTDQLRQMRTQQIEMRALGLRQQLTMAGYIEQTVQNPIVDYYKAQQTAQISLQEQWQKIAQAVQAKNVTDTEMATMLNDFRAALDKEKERREAAYKTLSDAIELPKKPMLDALLMTMGLAGDEASLVGQGNNGGRGGGFNIMGGNFGGGPGGGGFGGPGGFVGPGGGGAGFAF